MVTREEWLRKAVYVLDAIVFEGDLDTLNHKFQISCGIVPWKKLTATVQPYDGEDVRLEDFFATSIVVSHTIKDPMDILGNLARECVFAFFNESKVNKRVKGLMEKYYFEQPYKEYHPSSYLKDLLGVVLKQVEEECGSWPGETVVIHEKEKKEAKKNTLTMFCGTCGYEIKVARKMHEKHGQGFPTCVCGAKMAVDYGEDEGLEEKEN